MTFHDFYTQLKASNPIWWDSLQVSYPRRDYDGIAKVCWSWLLSCNRLPPKKDDDWQGLRNAYAKFLWTAPEVNNVIKYQEFEEVKEEPQKPPLTGEARMAKLKEFEKILLSIGEPEKVKDVSNKVYHVAQQIKKIDYTPPSGQDIYKRDRHFAWVKYCFDSKTAEPNENWMPEAEFDEQYDLGIL